MKNLEKVLDQIRQTSDALLFVAFEFLSKDKKNIIPELILLLENSQLSKFIKIFGGETLYVPNEEEFRYYLKLSTVAYYYIIDGKPWPWIKTNLALSEEDLAMLKKHVKAIASEDVKSQVQALHAFKSLVAKNGVNMSEDYDFENPEEFKGLREKFFENAKRGDIIPTESKALNVAAQLNTQLAELERDGNRKDIIEKLKDKFLAGRMQANSKTEQARALATIKLLEKLETDDLSIAQLLKIMEITSATTTKDSDAVQGVGTIGKALGAGGIIINNNPQTANINNEGTKALPNQSVKSLGNVLKGMESINNSIEMQDLVKVKNSLGDLLNDDE
jgi:hypothetical protein